MILIISAMCVAGCREPERKAVPAPEPPVVSAPHDRAIPAGKDSKQVRALGADFCKASLKADFQGIVDLFDVGFLIKSNPGIAALNDEDAIADMTRKTQKAMRDDMKTSRTARITDCEVTTAQTVPCMDMARYVVRFPREDLTTGSIKAALDGAKIKECGVLAIRETSNAAGEEPVFLAGKVENKWMILLGMPQL
jgi:hypothetical protein